jgi:hypothetical protein
VVAVKYMIMMFGSAEEMMQVQSADWVAEMISFMTTLNDELTASGELVAARGLVDGSQAKTVSLAEDGTVVTTDGPYAESKESIVGYWVLDVDSEERAVEICGRIVQYARSVELRRVADAPPEL